MRTKKLGEDAAGRGQQRMIAEATHRPFLKRLSNESCKSVDRTPRLRKTSGKSKISREASQRATAREPANRAENGDRTFVYLLYRRYLLFIQNRWKLRRWARMINRGVRNRLRWSDLRACSQESTSLAKLIGEGGMGSVYVALHTGLNAQVAIKLLAENFVTDSDSLTRFAAKTTRWEPSVTTTWFLFILVRSDSSIRNISELAGKPFCFVKIGSTSGWLIPRREFRHVGINPDTDFSAIRYGQNHLGTLNQTAGQSNLRRCIGVHQHLARSRCSSA